MEDGIGLWVNTLYPRVKLIVKCKCNDKKNLLDTLPIDYNYLLSYH